jgi:hypothetical protein
MNLSIIGPPLTDNYLLKKSEVVAKYISGMYEAYMAQSNRVATISFVIILL